jgi:cystathionine beta-lyase
MKYNFDEIIPRRGTNSVKWDETSIEDVIPLWVADMDFRTFPPIIEALYRRVDHGVFGYTHVPESYYESVISWFSKRHGLSGVVPADIIYTTGVVPAVSAIIRGLTLPGDKVLIQTPVYNCFFSSIRNQGCIVEESHLVYENNTYTVDWEDFERKCSDSRVRIFLLCNPHNPAGRVWTEEELRRMGEICLKYDVFVIADEIHCELVMPGHHYTPFASLSPEFLRNSATCVAPTKAFNIAGLQIANIIVKDSHKRERIDRAINLHEVCDVNPFGVIATEVAYTGEGAEWLSQLNEYIAQNYDYLCQFIAGQLPQFCVVKLEGTYLSWVDCSALGVPSSVLVECLLTKYGVWLNDSEMYGEKNRSFVRINLACPRAVLAEGLQRMARGISSFRAHAYYNKV